MSLVIAMAIIQLSGFHQHLEPSTVFTSFLVFTSHRNLFKGFHQLSGFHQPSEPSSVFTSFSALLSPRFSALLTPSFSALLSNSFSALLNNSFQVDGFIAKSDCGELHLHFLISVFKSFVSGPDSYEKEFRRMDFISPQEFQRGLTGFTLHKMAAVFYFTSHD